ncbi:MAG TPA: diadenylate cyclase CdaA [Bacteroidales bacterium]|nr:diadenylate cyclase CdaA [Bacteroidales bacterium]
MSPLFIHIRILDVLDIVLVALLMYQLYMLVRGTVAINIIIGILSIYFFWGIVKMLKMELLSTILGQVIGVGVIALIIVFQQEIRRFLIFIGTRYISRNRMRFERMLRMDFDTRPSVKLRSVMKAVISLAGSRTGALIVIKRKSTLDIYAQAGDVLNADTSSRLILSIFNKLSPLHDGAIIIDDEKISAARVVLPVTDNPDLPPEFGLRHRAAIGITEMTDAVVVVVSEETGQISFAQNGRIYNGLSPKELMTRLENEYQGV